MLISQYLKIFTYAILTVISTINGKKANFLYPHSFSGYYLFLVIFITSFTISISYLLTNKNTHPQDGIETKERWRVAFIAIINLAQYLAIAISLKHSRLIFILITSIYPFYIINKELRQNFQGLMKLKIKNLRIDIKKANKAMALFELMLFVFLSISFNIIAMKLKYYFIY